ncbi:MAG: MFS transporter [Propionibacteriaceae bacterium]|jgi:predicted MFS family arabinose efflux permease|nr:MFS transporter [Propionibacteriaceae bacterium]
MANPLAKLGFSKKTLIYFVIIATNSQIIYSFQAIREVLYDPFVENLGVTNAQFGVLMGIIGACATFGNVPLGWIQDRFSIRKVLSVNTAIVGCLGMFIALYPNKNFAMMVPCFILLGLCVEPLYWATVLKSVRAIAKEDSQATAFGFLEFGRGMTVFIQNAIVIGIYTLFGQTLMGIKFAIIFNACVTLCSAALVWFVLPEEDFIGVSGQMERTKIALSGLLKALRLPEVWLTGIAACCVYTTFVAVSTYFVPYLQKVYILPVAVAGLFGLLGSNVTRWVAGPISGLTADAKFKTSAHWMRWCYLLLGLGIGGCLLVPHNNSFVILAVALLLVATLAAYLIRGVYYAPIGESNVPKAMGAAAMSVASFIGYSPGLWAYPLFGSILDKYEADPTQAYQIIFTIMFCLCVLGFVLTNILGHRIVRLRERRNAEIDVEDVEKAA